MLLSVEFPDSAFGFVMDVDKLSRTSLWMCKLLTRLYMGPSQAKRVIAEDLGLLRFCVYPKDA